MSDHNDENLLEFPPIAGINSLPRERQPASDLWPGIQARLPPRTAPASAPLPLLAARPQRRRAASWPMALAASLCVATLLGLMLPQLVGLQWRGTNSLKTGVQNALGQLAAARLERQTGLAATPSTSASAVIANASAALDASREMLASRLPTGTSAFRTLRSESGEWPVPGESGLVHAAYSRSERPARRVSGRGTGEWQAIVRADTSQQAVLRANLKLMRDAEREVQRALRADPESDSLQEMRDQLRSQQRAISRLLVATRD